MRPMPLLLLREGAGFLWHHTGQWRLYQVHKRWQDGILAACCHPHLTHQLFLPLCQWVVGLTTAAPEHPHKWLSILGPTWQAPTFSVGLYGRSMSPQLPPHTTLSVAPLGPGTPRRGQIVVWGQRDESGTEARWVAHRIQAVEEHPSTGALYTTRGDANRNADPSKRHHHLLGRVTAAEHEGNPRSLGYTARQRARWHLLSLRHGLGGCRWD